MTADLCSTPQACYCSQTCQKTHWKEHRQTCASAQKHNCFLIRARPASSAQGREADAVEPFPLRAYGDEAGEIRELKSRLGWRLATEVGKFYTHRDDNDWYYYVYGPAGAVGRDGSAQANFIADRGPPPADLPYNELASRCIGGIVHGDVAVIRSGPAHSNSYSEVFSKADLVRTIAFYRDVDPGVRFQQKEKQRVGGMMGMP